MNDVSFLGLNFQPMTTEAAISHIAMLGTQGAGFHYVVTPNVDHRVRLERQADLRPLYDDANLLLNDSRILELLARKDGLDMPASPGADIVAGLFAGEIKVDEPVVVIGCDEEDIEALKARFGLTDVRWHAPPMGLKNNPAAIAEAAAFMAENPARFHFVCVGSPQQEMVAHAAQTLGDVQGVALCCGASLDFLTGKTARAPGWMRKTRLEWLHRLSSEPKRMARRYLIEGPAILRIWRRYRTQ